MESLVLLIQGASDECPEKDYFLNSGAKLVLARGFQPFGVSALHWKKKSCLGLYIKYIATCNHGKNLITF